MDVGSINGNMGIPNRKNVTGLQGTNKLSQPLFNGINRVKTDVVEFNNSLSSDTTDRLPAKLDEIASVGF